MRLLSIRHDSSSVWAGKASFGSASLHQDTSKHSCKGKNDCKGQGGCKAATMAAKARTAARARAAAQPTAPRSCRSPGAQFSLIRGQRLRWPCNFTLPEFPLVPANRFNGFTDYGVGIGLRIPHYRHILQKKPVVDWFEIISENYMIEGGRPLEVLDQILDQYKVVQHGVSMYFGSAATPIREHLQRLKQLVKRTKTPWLSDHLCWGSVDGRYTHDLLPMPYTWEAVRSRRIASVMCRIFSKSPSLWRTCRATPSFTYRR